MDKKIEILLGSYKNSTSINVDNYDVIELSNNVSEIMDYDVNDVISASDVFDAEREEYNIYRIYGRIEYMSLLNNLNYYYTALADFFTIQTTGNTKNIFNSFDFYLVRPASSGYTLVTGIISTTGNTYVRYFEVIATPDDFELYNAGFSNNVYGEQVYAFSFKKDFDVSTYFDNFGFPITQLFLYAKYKPSQNGLNNPIQETFNYTNWGTNGKPIQTFVNQTPLITGNTVYGDLINYSQANFSQTNISGQTYYISTTCTGLTINGGNPFILIWQYNPFIPLNLAYFTNELSTANTGSTSYDVQTSIPAYAMPVDNVGNIVWRDIMPQGYTDPLTGIGVNYPFVNQRRYLFAQIILSVIPDLNDLTTEGVFNQIYFTNNPNILQITPNTDLSNIGKPC